MLNKRHCSPAKGLKSRRHCALSSLLVLVLVFVVLYVVVVIVVGPRKKEREDEGVLPANANLLIPSVPGNLCSKQIRRTPPPSPPFTVRLSLSPSLSPLFDRATCLSDGKTCIDWISHNINRKENYPRTTGSCLGFIILTVNYPNLHGSNWNIVSDELFKTN